MTTPQFIIRADAKKLPIKSEYLRTLRDDVKSDLPHVKITKIRAVSRCNKYSSAAYRIKKIEFLINYGKHCPTRFLYHVTAADNVPSILQNNLDWRRVTRSRYGAGVSFSDSVVYANTYCNKSIGSHRALIVFRVLIGNESEVGVNYYTECPPNNIHTHRSNTKRVFVKFEDSTFYPAAVVFYNTDGSDYFDERWTKINNPSNTLSNTMTRLKI